MTLVPWTDDRIAELSRLWTVGYTCARIANDLGGVTRNAVIGKVRRLKLPFRGKGEGNPRPARSKGSAPQRRIRLREPLSFAVPPDLTIVPLAPARDNITIIDLGPNECRFSIGGGEGGVPYFFCGHSKREGSSYCAHHASVAVRLVYETHRRRAA